MKFAESTGCFYPPEFAYINIPGDAIDVPKQAFEAAMAREPGEQLVVVDGKLVIGAAPTVAPAILHQWSLRAALARVDAVHTEWLERAGNGAKAGERATWPLKASLARCLLTETSPTEVGQALLTGLGFATAAEGRAWARVIVNKATSWAAGVGAADRWRRCARRAIGAATDEQALRVAMIKQLALAEGPAAAL